MKSNTSREDSVSLIPTTSSSETGDTSYSEGRRREGSVITNDHINASGDGRFEQRGPTRRDRVRDLTRKTKAKTRILLGRGAAVHAEGDLHGEEDEALGDIRSDPAFNMSKIVQKKGSTPTGTAGAALATLQTVATTVIHPKRAIKSKATRTTAGQLSKGERPFSSRGADQEFLEAYDNLQRAESTSSSRMESSGDEQDPLLDKSRLRVEELERQRESLRVAWTTKRHIQRIRVVPKRHIKYPDTEAFVEHNANGDFLRWRWERWLGHALLYYTQDFSVQYVDDFDELPFDIDSLRLNVERLVMSSGPWQKFAVDLRSVYRWENPAKTGKWFVLYVILWYTEHIVGFLWAYIIYLVVKNRFYPTSVNSLRESVNRTMDQSSAAHRFGELIDRHGREDWLEPVIDHLGPFIQLQVSDMANILEVALNFYDWRHPRTTFHTLIFLAVCLLISISSDMRFCMKIFWFIIGGAFFLCWPIGSLYPKYRYLVSPIKWVLWGIPTHSEWSFQYLRRQAQLSREQMIRQKVEGAYDLQTKNNTADAYSGDTKIPTITFEDYGTDDDDEDDWHSVNSSTSILGGSDILTFRAQYKNSIGRLIIYSSGLRFVSSLTKKELWNHTFLELVEMKKAKGSGLARVALLGSEQLELKLVNRDCILLEAVKNRDEAFNTIVGFSGLQWQVLQNVPGDSTLKEVNVVK